MLYRLILFLRHLAYDKGWKKSFDTPVPSVCVGNITVGGTGKTPHTEMIVRKLIASHCWPDSSIAVLSRGYRRKSRGFLKVQPGGTASMYGDEPLQIACKFPSVSVAVDKDRVNGCEVLAKDGAGVIVLDDAFQYRRLKASLNIVLVDYNRPIFKDRLMPWGRLRDLPSRIKAADVVIVTKCPAEPDTTIDWRGLLGLDPRQKLYFTGIGYDAPQPVFPEADPRYLYAHKLILLSGIANDSPLRSYLSDTYRIEDRISLPDHHAFTRADVRRLRSSVKACPIACIMTTEKDAQRLRERKDMPSVLRERLFYVPISASFLNPADEIEFSGDLVKALGGTVLL